MRKGILATILLLVALVSFGFDFGGGGPMLMYFPGGTLFGLKNINVPVVDFPDFSDGIIAFGGYGYGGIPGMSYSGGFGFGGEKVVNKDGNKFKVGISGGFGAGYKNLAFGNVSLLAGLGFGGVNVTVGRFVNENNTSMSDLENGTLEGYLIASIDYYAVSADLSLNVSLTSFMQISIGAMLIGGYSIDGWTVNGKALQGVSDSSKFLLMYSLYGGVGFGF